MHLPRILWSLACCLLPHLATAATLAGTLVDGGGTDDLQLIVQGQGAERVVAYCDQQCGDWFDEDVRTESYRLKARLKGRKVVLRYAEEPNRDRVAGEGPDERVHFIKKLHFLP
ncbi:hypothetical protein [Eleftheria terrae]|uniref:hypothetical protein n=1 Tax=Eleftheria terrae TaxID=1597781 RepID=UPI00263B9722|nr:hypothetical protein [Eleftheria terrae]WKB55815.1 hypothetical protein N7L95_27430 [Eleftheria terrae]